jgi:predicted ferric reductase
MAVALSVAFGYMGLAIMALEFSIISRVRPLADAFGEDALQQFHQQMGVVSLLFLAAHPFSLIMGNELPMLWLLSPLQPLPTNLRLGQLSLLTMLLLVFLALGRRSLNLSYGWWQLSHALLALAAISTGLIHTLTMGSYATAPVMRLMLSGYLLFMLLLLAKYRLLRPLSMLRHPWQVIRLVAEKGNAHTLVLRPDGHGGFSFLPGQFVWLCTANTPFGLEQHPISISSSAANRMGDISLTIKGLGDWSSQEIPHLQIGKRVWVDGPHGIFSSDREQGMGYFFIAGGIGIAPIRSMLLTLADRNDRRPVTLIFGMKTLKECTFRHELEGLSGRLDLQLVYVPEQPTVDWQGEVGMIGAELLRRHLPPYHELYQYFVCGPPPLMDSMEKVLPRLGVPRERIHTERFDLV